MSKNAAPIETAEPQGIDIPVTTEARQMLAELSMPARVEAVTARVAGLKPKVGAAVDKNLQAAAEAIAGTTRVTELRQAGQSLRVIHTDYAREKAAREPAILADQRLSAQGKGDELRKLAANRDARIERLQRQFEQTADLLRIWYPPPTPPPLSQAASMQGMLFASLFPHAPADTALADIAGWVDAAVDGGASDETRKDAMALLYHVGRPLLARRSLSPEKHAEPFARAYSDMQGMVDKLIDSWGQRPHRGIATELADQATQRFRFARNMAGQHGWDKLIESATADAFEW